MKLKEDFTKFYFLFMMVVVIAIHQKEEMKMAKRKLSRRDFLRLGGLGAALAFLGKHGLKPGFAQEDPKSILPPELIPGSPDDPMGWETIMPPLPEGWPVDPPVTLTSSRRVGPSVEFVEGDDIDNNPFTRMMAAFGINWNAAYTWVSADDGMQKLNLAIASGDLPDMMETVPLQLFVEMLEADLLEDITDVYEEYASEEWMKEPYSYGGGLAWSYAEVDGRKYGLPYVEAAAQDDKALWIRTDWLEKLGLDAPTTLEELEAVALAFAEADMGQGAEGSTIGLSASKEFVTWYSSLDPVFGGFGVMPGFWTENDDGSLGNDSVRPEMKDALALLRSWYEKGVLAPDFFTWSAGDTAEALVGGNRVGLHFSPSFAAGYGCLDSMTNDPEARWTFIDIPAGPAGKHKYWSNPFPSTLYCFRKGFEHVDLVIQQTNWLAELVQNYANRYHGWEGVHYTLEDGVYDPGSIDHTKEFYGPVGTAGNSRTDPLHLAKEYEHYIEIFGALPEDERDAYMNYVLSDPTGMSQLEQQAYIDLVEKSDEQGIKNLFTTLPTATMLDRSTTLETLEEETFVGIINGELPLDEFDNFVDQWKTLGGDDITAEVNEWWQNK